MLPKGMEEMAASLRSLVKVWVTSKRKNEVDENDWSRGLEGSAMYI